MLRILRRVFLLVSLAFSACTGAQTQINPTPQTNPIVTMQVYFLSADATNRPANPEMFLMDIDRSGFPRFLPLPQGVKVPIQDSCHDGKCKVLNVHLTKAFGHIANLQDGRELNSREDGSLCLWFNNPATNGGSCEMAVEHVVPYSSAPCDSTGCGDKGMWCDTKPLEGQGQSSYTCHSWYFGFEYTYMGYSQCPAGYECVMKSTPDGNRNNHANRFFVVNPMFYGPVPNDTSDFRCSTPEVGVDWVTCRQKQRPGMFKGFVTCPEGSTCREATVGLSEYYVPPEGSQVPAGITFAPDAAGSYISWSYFSPLPK